MPFLQALPDDLDSGVGRSGSHSVVSLYGHSFLFTGQLHVCMSVGRILQMFQKGRSAGHLWLSRAADW